jgi:uncharacterized protein YbaP (TraB family)
MSHPARRGLVSVTAATALVIVGLLAGPSPCQTKTSLWKVSNGKGTAYLLGSIHLLKEADYPLDAKFDRAFEEADVVVFEVVPDSLEAPSVQSYIFENVLLGEGKTLQSELGDSVFAAASARAESLGIDLGPMKMFKPWFVSVALALAEMQKMGFDPALGVEMHFAERAKTAEKSIVGLETAKYQLGLFMSLAPEEQRNLLMHTLAQLSTFEEELEKIRTAWKTGDLESLQNTLNRSFEQFPSIYETLVTNRNRNWVAEIETFLQDDKTYLVIIGVGHMPGGEGLIELLKAKGYVVEQV